MCITRKNDKKATTEYCRIIYYCIDLNIIPTKHDSAGSLWLNPPGSHCTLYADTHNVESERQQQQQHHHPLILKEQKKHMYLTNRLHFIFQLVLPAPFRHFEYKLHPNICTQLRYHSRFPKKSPRLLPLSFFFDNSHSYNNINNINKRKKFSNEFLFIYRNWIPITWKNVYQYFYWENGMANEQKNWQWRKRKESKRPKQRPNRKGWKSPYTYNDRLWSIDFKTAVQHIT